MGAVTAYAIILGVVLLGLDRFGLLDWLKPKSNIDAAGELNIAEHVIGRITAERDAAIAERDRLEQERSLQSVYDRLDKTVELQVQAADLQAKVLDRLVHHNGSFQHMEESLRDIHNALQTLTGFVLTVAEVPAGKPKRKKAASADKA